MAALVPIPHSAQSAPSVLFATGIPNPASPALTPYARRLGRIHSTPPKRKSCCADEEQRHASKRPSASGKRPSGSGAAGRSASAVTILMQEELRKATFRSASFFEQFVFASDESGSGSIDGRADAIMKSLCEANRVEGLSWNPLTKSYFCDPPDYLDPSFASWFCGFANAIAALCPPPATPGPSATPTWIVTRTKNLSGAYNDRRRPDFALFSSPRASAAGDFTWRDILVVGEHQSRGSSLKASFTQLSCYAEQVFIAQPFRNAVLGVLTTHTNPKFEIWRFDRAGALGSCETSYWTGKGLAAFVCALRNMSTGMGAEQLGFRTMGIQWAEGKFPVDGASVVSTPLQALGGTTRSLHYKQLVFCAKGLVSRGTRVWTGVIKHSRLGAEEVEEVEVAIKEAWRSIGRDSEAHLYALAAERGVQGLPALLDHATYEAVCGGVRLSHSPTPPQHPSAIGNDTAKYPTFIAAHNRIFSRLVLNRVGLSISDHTLSPLAIARALLAAVIGHASLFFTGKILHRDLSPYNILAFPHGVSTPLPAPATPAGMYGRQTTLHGTLIDLDYALDLDDTSNPRAASGAKDRTGTYPFLAIALIRKGPVSHRYRHDLESLLYVLLYVALYPRPTRPSSDGNSAGAGEAEAAESDPSDLDSNEFSRAGWDTKDPLKIWFNEAETYVAQNKQAWIVGSWEDFSALLAEFRPGFEGFEDAAARIRRALWAVEGGAAAGEVCQLLPEGEAGATGSAKGRAQGAPGRGTGAKGLKGVLKSQTQRRQTSSENGGPRRSLHPGEVRVGVPNWEAYLEVREALEDLVDWYMALEALGEEGEAEGEDL